MKVTKSQLKQIIKEELQALDEINIPGAGDMIRRGLEKERQASPERQLAVYKAKLHKMRRDHEDQIREMTRLRRQLAAAEEMLTNENQSPDLQKIMRTAGQIALGLEANHRMMLDLKNM